MKPVTGFQLFVFCSILVDGLYISNCNEDQAMPLKFVEGIESPIFYCFGSQDPNSTFTWTLHNSTGERSVLGTCYSLDNCSTSWVGQLQLTRVSALFAKLQFYNIRGAFAGTLTCTETRHNVILHGDVSSSVDMVLETASCVLSVGHVRIKSPADHKEGQPSTISCHYEPFAQGPVSWTLDLLAGQTLSLGTCATVGRCTTPFSPLINVTRDSDVSLVQVANMSRDYGGEIHCSLERSGVVVDDRLLLNVYTEAAVENCSLALLRQNWSAVLSCEVDNVFSSAGFYNFSVLQDRKMLQSFAMTLSNSYVFNGRRSLFGSLTSYIAKGKEYYRGRLLYSWFLSPEPAVYSRYTVRVFFGLSVNKTVTIDKEDIIVPPPSRPYTNCSFLPERGPVTCHCVADTLGYPAGRIIWQGRDNATLATGIYGVTLLALPPASVSRLVDHVTVTCVVDWVHVVSSTFSIPVAYGPDQVTLDVSESYDNNVLHLLVTCHVMGVRPLTGLFATWQGFCQGQSGFTCNLTTASPERLQGEAVACRVTNTLNGGLTAAAALNLQLKGQAKSATTGPQPTTPALTVANATEAASASLLVFFHSEKFTWFLIGGGSVLGVVIVIIVVIIAARVCGYCKDSVESPMGERSEEFSHYTHMNSGLNRHKPQGSSPKASSLTGTVDLVHSTTGPQGLSPADIF